VTLSILLALLGALNGTVMTGSRIAYAMAKDGQCIAAAGTKSKRFGTPAVALWLQAGWALLLVYTHTFEALMNYASAAMLATGVLTVCAVFVLRRKLPDMPRPYRTWGYPFTPFFYVVSSLAVLGVLVHDRNPSVAAVAGWFALALGFHWLVMRRRKSPANADQSGVNESATGRA